MSSPRELLLRVKLDMIDKASAALNGIHGRAKAAADSLKAARDKLHELESQQRNVKGFQSATDGLQAHSKALADAQAKVARYNTLMDEQRARHLNIKGALKAAKQQHADLAEQMGKSDGTNAELNRQLQLSHIRLTSVQQSYDRSIGTMRDYKAAVKNGQDASKRAAEGVEKAGVSLEGYRQRLQRAGIDTSNLANTSTNLASKINAATEGIEAQRNAMEALNKVRGRYIAAQAEFDKRMALAGKLGMAGAGAAAVGATVLHGYKGPIEEAKGAFNEMQRIGALGVGEQVTSDAVKFALGMNTYGVSVRENIGLMRDAITVFADLHHAEMVAPTLAKMKFANAALYGQEHGAQNERQFMDMLKVIELRGGLASESEFKAQADMIQRIIAATGGRVQANEWLNVIKTGGVAAKGMTSEAFFYGLEPLVQEMGGHRVGTAMMSAYQNIYQGHTTKRAAQLLDSLGLIADTSKVQHDKSGQIAHIGIGALAGSDLFRTNQFGWLEQVLLPKLAAKGITEKQQVLDTLGGIFTDRTASNLFAQMYLQREQIHKNAKLNAGAESIDQLYTRAKGTAGGSELELLARKADAYRELGTAVMPAYVAVLETAASVLKTLSEFMQENPTLARAMAYGIGGIAAFVGILGAALLGLAPAIAVIAGLNLGMAGLATVSATMAASLGLWLGRLSAFTAALGVGTLAGTLIANKIDAYLTAKAGKQTSLGTWLFDAFNGDSAQPTKAPQPLTAPGARGGTVTTHNQISITTQPGDSPKDVAAAVSFELDRRERAAQARRRSLYAE